MTSATPAAGATHIQLDAWRNTSTDVRVAVDAWWATTPVAGQFISRERSVRMVWNYLWRVGPVAAARKIKSRLAESRRNDKVAGVGCGRVVDAPVNGDVAPGDFVVFFAPNHSVRWPRITLDHRLVHRAAGDASSTEAERALERLRPSIGWTPYSGNALDTVSVRAALEAVARCAPATPRSTNVSGRGGALGRERVDRPRANEGRPSAVLFGLGNYAKTQVVPHVRRHLTLAAIHEIDPDQLESAASLGATLDTSPEPREDDRYDAWFIAGFHHSHADLAAHALTQGAYAVVEKPLVTTREQFARIRAAMAGDGAHRLFTCFHKRYSALHAWATADLGAQHGAPIDMHCIVYEIPLPPLHWYNWPNSGSRLVSNGCHWLDYFLFMNSFSPVVRRFVRSMRGSDLLVSVELENSAQFAMTLTDAGSERLGVRDVIDLRSRDRTVRLIDATYYEAETSARVVRRRRVNPMHAYRRMYDTICRRIVAGSNGDSPDSLASTELMLDLEDELQAIRASSIGRTLRAQTGSVV